MVVIFDVPAGVERTIVMQDGDAVLRTISAQNLSTILDGFVAYDSGNGVQAKTTFIVGDGQIYPENATFTGSQDIFSITSPFDGSDGAYWDTKNYDVSSYVHSGDTDAVVTLNASEVGSKDCLNWTAQVFSVTTGEGVSESELTLANPTVTEDDGVQDSKGVADKTLFMFSVTAVGNPDDFD
jgi:hypothetical protein